ncbi:MAG: Ig-like domain-containing protein [Lachnospiraceae bacterium]|nr:Ig-like domain-containing protein [Lachnospiraceae bacterium]
MERNKSKKIKKILGLLTVAALVGSAAPTTASAAYYQLKSEYKEMAKLNEAELTIYAGQTFQLELEGAKASAWKSTNKNWATVDKTGLITAKAVGEVNIVAVVSETESYRCHVTIKAPTLNRTKSNMYVGGKQTLELYGAKVKAWRSDNPKVAKINQKGEITAVAAGTTTIYCRDVNNKRYTCKLTVMKKKGNGGATPEDIAEQIPYEINKVYDEGEKIFMYYATNGAYGEIPDYMEWGSILRARYPGCTTEWNLNCVIQGCDGPAAGNWAGYSIYYTEYVVTEMGEPPEDMEKYYIVDFSHGDNVSNYFSEERREKVVRINNKNFPRLYKFIGVYDLNGDSYLSKGEIDQIGVLEIDGAISDLTGIEYLTSLWSMDLNDFIGTEIVLGEANKNLKRMQITCNTASFTVDAPYLDSLLTHTYYGVGEQEGKRRSDGTPYIDVSKCTGATSIVLQNSNVQTLKLPKSSTALKELTIWSSEVTSLNMKKYPNLESLTLSYNEKLTKVDLSSNKKLKSVWAKWNGPLKQSNIKLPKGIEVEVTYAK